jgi:hypothetical protein
VRLCCFSQIVEAICKDDASYYEITQGRIRGSSRLQRRLRNLQVRFRYLSTELYLLQLSRLFQWTVNTPLGLSYKNFYQIVIK